MKPPSSSWSVSDADLDGEFRYWVAELFWSLGQGAIFAVIVGVAIAAAPGESPQLAFARDVWTYLVELAFWLGMLIAMLWSGIKRAAAFVTGVPPWRAKAARRAEEPR